MITQANLHKSVMLYRSVFRISFIVLAVVSMSASLLQASPIPAISKLSRGTLSNGFTQTTLMGYRFSPTRDLNVTSLGIFDKLSDGLATDMRVGLFQQTDARNGVELTTVTVPVGTTATLIDRFRYVDLPAPLRLKSNETYQIATIFLSRGSEGFIAGSSFATNPLLSNVSWRAVQSDSYTDVVWFNSNFGGSVIGPNFQFEVVPEPTTQMMLILMMVLMSRDIGRSMVRKYNSRIATGKLQERS